MRIGNGYDIHRFRDGNGSLRLGGVDIDDAPRLDGHSDGDALIHAIIDALLGAAGEGDIGRHFPPDDPALRDIDSRELLKRVQRLVFASGYHVLNIDATVIAQRPRLAPHIDRMRESIALTLGLNQSQVNVKATTNEGIGELGAGDAVAALAVALLEEDVR